MIEMKREEVKNHIKEMVIMAMANVDNFNTENKDKVINLILDLSKVMAIKVGEDRNKEEDRIMDELSQILKTEKLIK